MDLSAAERLAYQQQGFFIRTGVFTPAEIVDLRSAADRVQALAASYCARGREYHLDGNRFVDVGAVTVQFEHQRHSPWVRVVEPVNAVESTFDELLDDARLVVPMQGLVGSSELALWTVKLNFKPATCGSGFGWHQDSPYWQHACAHVDLLPNVMLALDDAHVNNGCLQVVPGSHVGGVLPGCDDGRQLGGFYTDQTQFDPAQAYAVEMVAGSCVFFSPHTVHGSGPNLSQSPRRAVIATYQPTGFATLKSGELRAVG